MLQALDHKIASACIIPVCNVHKLIENVQFSSNNIRLCVGGNVFTLYSFSVSQIIRHSPTIALLRVVLFTFKFYYITIQVETRKVYCIVLLFIMGDKMSNSSCIYSFFILKEAHLHALNF